jgi:hypothetical protein
MLPLRDIAEQVVQLMIEFAIPLEMLQIAVEIGLQPGLQLGASHL